MDTNALVTALRKHEIFTDFQSFTQSTFTHNFTSSADPPDTILVQLTQRFPSLLCKSSFRPENLKPDRRSNTTQLNFSN